LGRRWPAPRAPLSNRRPSSPITLEEKRNRPILLEEFTERVAVPDPRSPVPSAPDHLRSRAGVVTCCSPAGMGRVRALLAARVLSNPSAERAAGVLMVAICSSCRSASPPPGSAIKHHSSRRFAYRASVPGDGRDWSRDVLGRPVTGPAGRPADGAGDRDRSRSRTGPRSTGLLAMSLLRCAGAASGSGAYLAVLFFFALYPVLSSLVWISTSFVYYWRWSAATTGLLRHRGVPAWSPCSCLHSARRRSSPARSKASSRSTIVQGGRDRGRRLTDGTAVEIAPYIAARQVRLIRKRRNEGKRWPHDAIPIVNGRSFSSWTRTPTGSGDLRWMVPHFGRRAGGGDGNPRVANRQRPPGQAPAHRVRLDREPLAPCPARVGAHPHHVRRVGRSAAPR